MENTIQRCNKIAMASRRAAEMRLGLGGFSCVRGLDARGDKLWAESAKDAAQKLNQAASPSNPGRVSPQELFTRKKGAFLVVPFFGTASCTERGGRSWTTRQCPATSSTRETAIPTAA